jgi:arylsulfatase A-like enzyme
MAEPWFLCLHLWEAHAPYQNPPPFDEPRFGATPHDQALSLVDVHLAELFKESDFSGTSLLYMSDHGERLVEDYLLNQELDGEEWQVLKVHRQFVRQSAGGFDYEAWFGFLSRALGETRARIYAHNVLGHGFHLTEDLIRTPLVIADPDLDKGRTVEGLRSQKDLHDTLLDLAGCSPGSDSLLDGTGREKIYIEANGSGGKQFASRCYLRGARTERFKYWRVEAPGEHPAVLWDLREDPRETHNCIEAHPDAARDLDAFVTNSLEQRTEPSSDPENAAAIEAKMRELGYL